MLWMTLNEQLFGGIVPWWHLSSLLLHICVVYLVYQLGLRLLKEREELKQLRLAELRKEIAIGSAEADRGEFVDGEATFAAIRKRSAILKRAKG